MGAAQPASGQRYLASSFTRGCSSLGSLDPGLDQSRPAIMPNEASMAALLTVPAFRAFLSFAR